MRPKPLLSRLLTVPAIAAADLLATAVQAADPCTRGIRWAHGPKVTQGRSGCEAQRLKIC
jgi:hypothetical protein